MAHAHSRRTHARLRRMVGGLAVAAVLGAGAATASAQVEIPTRAGAANAAQPASAPAAPAAAALNAPAVRRSVRVVLRMGSRGVAVKRLQLALRKRGIRLAPDGVFGPATRRGVRIMQLRMRMRPTGVAHTTLLRRLRLPTRAIASAPVVRRATRGTAFLDVFPALGRDYTYFDDYGNARHQGAHQGNDIMADRGTPLVAVVDATVDRVQRTERGLGGIYVWLERADGTEYYYAHMDTIAANLAEGDRVAAGQVIGTIGNTGDARGGAPHLHFEIRLRGNRIINPYTHLVAVDPNRKSAAQRR